MGSRALVTKSIILHADLDCFYCQVEQKRLEIPPTIPLCVQQWSSVIAVNYAARSFGITRHSNLDECFEKCPELRMVHVSTYSVDAARPGACKYYPATIGRANVIRPDRKRHKASLDPYRKAGSSIFAIMKQFTDNVEKASVDEAYLDVTQLVEERISEVDGEDIDWSKAGSPAVNNLDQCFDLENWQSPMDIKIWIGSQIAKELCDAIYEELGFTVSVGIAHNKMLAKLASGKNKPRGRTFVLDGMVKAWMQATPLVKIRFLGGRLGRQLVEQTPLSKLELQTNKLITSHGEFSESDSNEWEDDHGDEYETEYGEKKVPLLNLNREEKIMMASDLWSLSLEELGKRIGDYSSAQWVYDAIRGIDNSLVNPRIRPKSLLSAKSFQKSEWLNEWEQVHQWVSVLVAELSARLEEYTLLWPYQWPRTLVISYRSSNVLKTRSKSSEFPFTRKSLYQSDELIEHVMKKLISEHNGNEEKDGKVFRKDFDTQRVAIGKDNGKKRGPMQQVLPCWFLGISLTRFEEAAGSHQSIKEFFSKQRSVSSHTSHLKQEQPPIDHSIDEIDIEPETAESKLSNNGPMDQFLVRIQNDNQLALSKQQITMDQPLEGNGIGSKKRKRSQKLLDSFVTIQKGDVQDQSNDIIRDDAKVWQCPECRKVYSVDRCKEITEHCDYHLAIKLSAIVD